MIVAFPTTPLGLRGELRIGQVWQSITGDLYTRDPITHTRGLPYLSSAADPATCSATIRNADGRYTPRNPEGPFYGLLGRGTPMRISLPGGPVRYLAMNGAADRATTPDHAALDITGDLDIRWDGEADWYAKGAQMLIGKWAQAGNRSYHLRIENGTLTFVFSNNGTTGYFINVALPAQLPRRAALRATIDVDNGAGAGVVSAYWATTMDGPWTLLGSGTVAGPVVGFNSSAPLSIAPAQPDATIPRLPMTGRTYRAEVRNGINGTVVAAPDFTARPLGTGGTFTDAAGRVWTLAADAEITDRVVRFEGEVPEWPPQWVESEQDAWTPVEAAGILRRLGQGKKPLQSTLRRRVPSASPLAYWPMEDGPTAKQAASALDGRAPLTVSGFTFAADDTLPGSEALPTLGQVSTLYGAVTGAKPGGWHVEMAYRLTTLPTTEQTMVRLLLRQGTGGVAEVRVRVSTAGIRVQGLDNEGAVVAAYLHTDANALAAFVGRWNRLQVFSAVSGSQTYIVAAWRDVLTNTWWYASTVYTGTPGTLTAVSGQWGADFQGMALGHLGVWDTGGTGPTAPSVKIYEGADDGFSDEAAGWRMQRLCQEEGVPLRIVGEILNTERMGPQRPAPLLDLLRECADADGGRFVESSDRRELLYRTRASLYNQTPKLVLDYAAGQLAAPFEPIEDDQVRNAWEVTRQGGSSGVAVLDSGPLSVQDPPAGIGLYDESRTLNLFRDEQTQPIASWLLHLSTWDEARYPSVTLLLHRCPELIPAVLQLAEGDKLRIINLPRRFTGSGTVDLLVDGWRETLLPREWTVTFTCSPAGPWTVGALEDPVIGRVDTDGSQLAAPAGATDTALIVQTPAGPPWITTAPPGPGSYPDEFPFDIRAGGEVMTVTGITPAVFDTFGRTASGGWGRADSGQTWTVSPAADHSVTAGYGVAAQPTAAISHLALLPAPSADADLFVDVATSALAVGASIFAGPIARAVDNNNLYMARVECTTAGAVLLTIRKRVAGAETQLGATYTSGLTHTAGSWYRVRFQVIGTALRAKVWPATAAEPPVWHVDTTDTALTAAANIGFRSFRNTGSTGVTETRFDNFQTASPQRFTVQRSRNGVVKPQAAGTAVSLAAPSVIAL